MAPRWRHCSDQNGKKWKKMQQVKSENSKTVISFDIPISCKRSAISNVQNEYSGQFH